MEHLNQPAKQAAFGVRRLVAAFAKAPTSQRTPYRVYFRLEFFRVWTRVCPPTPGIFIGISGGPIQ